jgi:hypothetical protein
VYKTGKGPREAVNSIWNKLELSTKAKEELAQFGLSWRVSQADTNGYVKQETNEVSVSFTGEEKSNSTTVLINVLYQTNDDITKPLIKFTVVDFEYCIERNNQRIEGLEARNEAFNLGKQLLVKHHAKDVKHLPVSAQQELARKWESTIKKKDKAA